MSHSQTSDSGMSEGTPIERWRKTCVAISSSYKKYFVHATRNGRLTETEIFIKNFFSPRPLPLKPQLSCCGFREWHHLSCFPVFVLFAANIFCLFLPRHNSFLQLRQNLIRIFHCLPSLTTGSNLSIRSAK